MKRFYLPILIVLLTISAVATVYAQTDDADTADPGIAISQDVFDVEVEVSYTVGDQIVRAKIPAQLTVDVTQAISSVVASHNSTVGIFGFEVAEMVETSEEFEYSQYGSFDEPSDGNKLVVAVVDIKNLWNETVNAYSLEAEAIDATGNYYDRDHKNCDEVHPGETGRCLFGFEVAEDVDLVSLAVSADDHKMFALPEPTAQE